MKTVGLALFLLSYFFSAAEAFAVDQGRSIPQNSTKPMRQNGSAPRFNPYIFPKKQSRFRVSGGLLYWRVDERGLDFGVTKDIPVYSFAGVPAYSLVDTLHLATFDRNLGFRLDAGYTFGERYWEVVGQYTQFSTQGSNRAHLPTTNPTGSTQSGIDAIYSTFLGSLSASTNMVSDLTFRYKVADLLLAKRFKMEDFLAFRFLAGTEMAWIRQKWVIHITNALGHWACITNQWSFGGAGLRVGLDSDWYLLRGVTLHVNGALSALCGTHKAASNIFRSPDNTGPFQDISPDQNRIISSMQLIGGISWSHAWCKAAARLFFGYELDIWANLHDLYRASYSLDANSNISERTRILDTSYVNLSGLTATAAVAF